MGERYLGDGLYVSFDGWQIKLRAPRENGDHWVALDPAVFQALIVYTRDIESGKVLPGQPDPVEVTEF